MHITVEPPLNKDTLGTINSLLFCPIIERLCVITDKLGAPYKSFISSNSESFYKKCVGMHLSIILLVYC